MRYVFISGMFRSGTTLMARMLSAHPEIAVASDPSLPLFKFFRSYLYKKVGIEIPYNYPLEDYYFSRKYLDYLDILTHANLSEYIEEGHLPLLKEEIKKYSEPYAPRVVDKLDYLLGTTFAELLVSLLDIIHDVYMSMGKTPKVVGIKEVWANEFILPLHNTYDNFLFIEIVRDPRAVSASKNVQDDKYPWLFLARQWRKLATFTLFHLRKLPREKHLLIKYEDLIKI